MSVDVRPIEAVVVRASLDDGDDIIHLVCHCTNDNVAACGLDVSELPPCSGVWADDDIACPLCALAWPDGRPTCPWGCSCEAVCGPEAGEIP